MTKSRGLSIKMTQLYSLSCLIPSLIEDDLSLLRGSLAHADWVPRTPILLPICHFKSSLNNPSLEEFHHDLTRIKWHYFNMSLQNIFLENTLFSNKNFIELRLGISQTEPLKHLHRKIIHLLHKHDINYSKKKYIPHYLLGHIEAHYQESATQWISRYNLFKSQEFSVDTIALTQATTSKSKKSPTSLLEEIHIIETYHAEDSLPSLNS